MRKIKPTNDPAIECGAPIKKSSDDWLKEHSGIVIIDHDGWDRSDIDKSMAELITESEFNSRVNCSTIHWKPVKKKRVLKKDKKVKVWVLTLDGNGYFADDPKFFLNDIEDMGEGDEFKIKCKMMTQKEIDGSPEFGGF